MSVASVEGDEIVIRIPISALAHEDMPRGFAVVDAAALAPHVAREIGGEDMSERLWLEPLIGEAIIRAVEGDAPGIRWDQDDAAYEGEKRDG